MFNYTPNSIDQSIKIALAAPDAEAVVLAETYLAGNIPINGNDVNLDKVTLTAVANVVYTSAGDDRGVLFYLKGKLEDGTVEEEYITGSNAGTASSVNQYEEVYETYPTQANTAGNVSVGVAGNATAVCAAQAGTENTPLLLNGTNAAGVYINEGATTSYLTATFVADETGNVFTVYGYDNAGRKYIYSLDGTAPGTVVYEIPFGKVYALTCSQNCAGDVSLGTSSSTATPWLTVDDARAESMVGLEGFVEAGSTLTYHVEWTWEDVNAQFPVNNESATYIPFAMVNDVNIGSGSNSTKTTQVVPSLKACRFVVESFTSGALYAFLNQNNKRTAKGV